MRAMPVVQQCVGDFVFAAFDYYDQCARCDRRVCNQPVSLGEDRVWLLSALPRSKPWYRSTQFQTDVEQAARARELQAFSCRRSCADRDLSHRTHRNALSPCVLFTFITHRSSRLVIEEFSPEPDSIRSVFLYKVVGDTRGLVGEIGRKIVAALFLLVLAVRFDS